MNEDKYRSLEEVFQYSGRLIRVTFCDEKDPHVMVGTLHMIHDLGDSVKFEFLSGNPRIVKKWAYWIEEL